MPAPPPLSEPAMVSAVATGLGDSIVGASLGAGAYIVHRGCRAWVRAIGRRGVWLPGHAGPVLPSETRAGPKGAQRHFVLSRTGARMQPSSLTALGGTHALALPSIRPLAVGLGGTALFGFALRTAVTHEGFSFTHLGWALSLPAVSL